MRKTRRGAKARQQQHAVTEEYPKPKTTVRLELTDHWHDGPHTTRLFLQLGRSGQIWVAPLTGQPVVQGKASKSKGPDPNQKPGHFTDRVWRCNPGTNAPSESSQRHRPSKLSIFRGSSFVIRVL
jgi:hypothetical protein